MRRRTVLIVEDDAQLRGMLRQALMFAGFLVEEASDGWNALRRIDERPPDLVVLDLDLPIVHGLTVQQQITAHARTRSIPIIIVTGSSESLDQVNVACILRKPISPEQVIEVIGECLRSGPG